MGGRRAPGLVAILVACAALAGCGDSGADESAPTTPRDAGLTAPGAGLTEGETATVPLSDGAGVIELTVTGIDKGAARDLAGISGLSGTPYYVRLEATAVSGDAYQFFSEQYVAAWAGDERLGAVQAPVTVGACTRAYFTLDPPVGSSIEPCLTFLVDPGTPDVDRVSFFNSDDYLIDDDSDVEWR